jgi:hypothetical protein
MIVFQNKGEIDLRSVKTFGISAKDHANPIGYFGTGLKYAIAVCLRHGCGINMVVGNKEYVFEKKNVEVRGKPFEMITMNGEELPFTTHLGANWELWQAFRELYCNAIDERGEVRATGLSPMAVEGQTHFKVFGSAFENLFHEKGSIVLEPPTHLRVNPRDESVEIYNRPSEYLYYRGIRVLKFEYPAAFTYNIIDKCDLTEDRTLKYDGLVMRKIPLAWGRVDNRQLLKKVFLSTPQLEFEATIDFLDLAFQNARVSREFEDVLEELFEANHDRLNTSAIRYLQKKKAKEGHKHYETSELNAVERKQLDRAKKVCAAVFPGFERYEIMIVRSLGEETMALADLEKQLIVIAKPSFERGTKYLMATMIEEYMHLKTGFGDCTRSMQTYLFDTICSLIENHHLGEPV